MRADARRNRRRLIDAAVGLILESGGEPTMDAVATRAPIEAFSPADATIVRYVRQLLREHAIADEAFDDARDRFGVRGVTDLTATVGFYSLIACTLNAFEVVPAADAPALP